MTGAFHQVAWRGGLAGCLLALAPGLGALTGEELADHLEQQRVRVDLPGLRAAVIHPGGLVQAAVGLADVEQNIPLTTTTGMPGGSTGKSFVAATAMKLVEDGTLDVARPMAHYLPEADWVGRLDPDSTITVEHLLTHASGVVDHVNDMDFALSMLWRRIRDREIRYTPVELIDFVLDNGLAFPPGQGYTYTDTGYIMLGLVIEAVAGQPYYSVLRQRILNPNELTGARPAVSASMPDVATGYVEGSLLMTMAGLGGRNMTDGVMVIDPSTEWTGGGLTTTPRDLARFYHRLANGQIVSPASYRQMVERGFQPAGERGHYGYGLYVDGDVVGHGGWFPGYRTNVRHFAGANVTVAIQTNSDREFDLVAVAAGIRALLND